MFFVHKKRERKKEGRTVFHYYSTHLSSSLPLLIDVREKKGREPSFTIRYPRCSVKFLLQILGDSKVERNALET